MTKNIVHVLLIEDNPADALLLKESLADDPLADFQVTVSERLKDGLAKLETDKFDVLLLDLGLPDSQGLETFATAHADFPGIPIIVLSGMANELLALQAVQSGAQDYLVKDPTGWEIASRTVRYSIERHQSQLSVRASEARFASFFHFSPTPTAITRLGDNHILEVNEAWTQVTGYSSAEVIGRDLGEFNLWVDPREREQIVETLRRQGVVRGFEFQLRRKSGGIVTLLLSAELIEVGGENCMLSMALDISGRKQAEDALRRKQAMLARTEGIAHIGSWEWDVATDTVMWSDELFRIFQMDPAEGAPSFAGQSKFYAPEDMQKLRQAVESAVSHGAHYEIELRALRRDGATRICLTRGHAEMGPQGKAVRLFGTLQDVTERVQAEEALRESEERYRSIFDGVQDAIFVETKDGRIVGANDRACELYGCSRAELIEKTVADLVPEGSSVFSPSTIQPGQSPASFETINRRADGSLFPVEISGGLQVIGGEEMLLVIVRDITERKQAEDRIQEQIARLNALRAIDLIISSSFDMNISLNAILPHVVEQLNADAADVLIVNPTSFQVEHVAGIGFRYGSLDPTSDPLKQSLAGDVILKGTSLSIPDLHEYPGDWDRTLFLEREKFVSYHGIPLIVKGYVKGILEVFSRTRLDPQPDWLHFMDALASQTAIAMDNIQLFNDLQKSNHDLEHAYDMTIQGWSHALDLRDEETEGHTQRVTDLTARLARQMGISEEKLVHIRRGALLHDIGKMGVPDHILLKPGALTAEEWVIMRRHPLHAYNLLAPIEFLRPALDIPHYHHEKWDGSGYPDGLKGDHIPLDARIFAVADVWDALRSDRPYRKGWSRKKALQYIREQSGKHFDPQVVEAFLGMKVE